MHIIDGVFKQKHIKQGRISLSTHYPQVMLSFLKQQFSVPSKVHRDSSKHSCKITKINCTRGSTSQKQGGLPCCRIPPSSVAPSAITSAWSRAGNPGPVSLTMDVQHKTHDRPGPCHHHAWGIHAARVSAHTGTHRSDHAWLPGASAGVSRGLPQTQLPDLLPIGQLISLCLQWLHPLLIWDHLPR